MGEATGTTLERRGFREDDEGPRQGPPPGGDRGFGGGAPPVAVGGFFQQYKREQGKSIRWGTLACAGALIAWGAVFLYDQLQVYEGDEWWRMLITIVVPIVFAGLFFALVWWVAFVSRTSSDFMIATEGEMKKVSWSSKREIIGSTKVVILFTLLMSLFLFVVDLVFMELFGGMGVLKR
jgi:preprotein translocase subunit SecE